MKQIQEWVWHSTFAATADIAKIIEYSVSFVNKNIRGSRVKSVEVLNKPMVAKQRLIDFMLTD